MINKIKLKINSDMHLKELLSGSTITFVLKMIGLALGYIIALMISQKYGANGIGIYNLTLSIITFFAMISSLGINVSILRYVGQFNNPTEELKLKSLYRHAVELVIPISLLLAFSLYIFSDILAEKIFNNSQYKHALQYAALIIPFFAIQNISVEYIRGLKKLKISEYLRSVNRPIVNITLLLIIGFYWSDELLPIYTMGAGVIVSSILAATYVFKKTAHIKNKKDSGFSKKELVSTSTPMMISLTSTFLMGNISLFMLEIFSTTSHVGIFSIAFKLAALVSLVLLVVNTILAPKFSELYWGRKYSELQSVMLNSVKIVYFFSFLIIIFFVLFSETMLGLFGAEFIAGKYVLLILMLGELINAITGPVAIFLNMVGKQKVLRNISLIALLITLSLSLLLIPTYSMHGAAIALVVGMAFKNITLTMYTKKTLKIKTYYIPLLKR